jgi:hypothetical protein
MFGIYSGLCTYPDDEENGEKGEASKLERLTSNRIDGCHCEPVSRNSTSTNEDAVTSRKVEQTVMQIVSTSITDGL